MYTRDLGLAFLLRDAFSIEKFLSPLIAQSSWSIGISETNLKLWSHAVSAWIGLWCHRLMHAPHRLKHACTACITLWHHRPMHAVTAWALLFWFYLRYTFISRYFAIRNLQQYRHVYLLLFRQIENGPQVIIRFYTIKLLIFLNLRLSLLHRLPSEWSYINQLWHKQSTLFRWLVRQTDQ